MLDKSSISSLIGVLFLPIYTMYIWIVFSTLHGRIPKIFVRLVISVILYILGVASMLCIDFAGHLKARKSTTSSSTMCMFADQNIEEQEPLLSLHSAFLLIPGLLLGIGPMIVSVTTFEFISAQSPFAMKGLLVGVFFFNYQGSLPACEWSSFDTTLARTFMESSSHDRASSCHQL